MALRQAASVAKTTSCRFVLPIWSRRRVRAFLVERFFRELTQEVIRHGSFTGIRELIADIEAFIIERNLNLKPCVWRAGGEKILRKIESAYQALAAQQAKT